MPYRCIETLLVTRTCTATFHALECLDHETSPCACRALSESVAADSPARTPCIVVPPSSVYRYLASARAGWLAKCYGERQRFIAWQGSACPSGMTSESVRGHTGFLTADLTCHSEELGRFHVVATPSDQSSFERTGFRIRELSGLQHSA